MERTPERRVRMEAKQDTVPLAAPVQSSPRRSTRMKKPPPITPRRFTRFFTPRVKNNQNHAVRTSRKALLDISGAVLNSRQCTDGLPPAKRRKFSFPSSPVSSSLPSSPVRRVGFLSSSQEINVDETAGDEMGGDDSDSEASTDIDETPPAGRLQPYRRMGLASRLLATRIDGRRSRRPPVLGSEFWQHETADFYSSPTDVNLDHGRPEHGPQPRMLALPFCATSCKTNSLVAVGDEDGYVRLIDSANEYSHTFGETHFVLQPHHNAILDLEFSHDDKYLATASGDQTCQLIDVQNHKSVWSLVGHTSSVKKVQFQPGSHKVLATCARDGTIQIWDTRQNPCKRAPHTVDSILTYRMSACEPSWVVPDAHPGRLRTRSNAFSGRNDFSVTSLSFIAPDRPHLYATVSESDAVVKLWDMRSSQSYRNKTVAISCTQEPASHATHRRFGITSMAMSTDNSKLYTLCRDHTVYAYSTSHLILGSAPEMSPGPLQFKTSNGNRPGFGPLYGFRDRKSVV